MTANVDLSKRENEKMASSDHIYWLGLKMIPAIFNKLYGLVENAGGPKELWFASKKRLIEIGLEEDKALEAIKARSCIDLEAEYLNFINSGGYILTNEDKEYPFLLRQAANHPKAVFVKGSLHNYENAVAIVSSRRASMLGKSIATELAAGLAEVGVVVVSGVARGIDTASHWGAINAGGLTLGVLGCGFNVVYPPENKKLYGEIASNGALISEYPPNTFPQAINFPARNRIIAGLCQGVVVVEAGEKSGALITADFALDYGRDVFAVPGNSKNEMSRGTNGLIKQGAYLVETVDDIIEVLGIDKEKKCYKNNLSSEEQRILNLIGWEPTHIDEIVCRSGWLLHNVSSILLSLEISGYLRKDISGSYMRMK